MLREEGHDDAGEFLDAIKRDVLRDSIIVYTPKGDPMELPEGSTAIDLAYHIHSEVGDTSRCCLNLVIQPLPKRRFWVAMCWIPVSLGINILFSH